MFAATVILIRIYAFYFGSPRLIKYITFTALRNFTYLYGTRSGGGGCEKRCFWRRSWSEWLSATPFPSRFLESGKVTPAQILQTLRFPGSAAFHRRVEDFRPAAMYAALHGYTFASPLCVRVCGPDFTGALHLRGGPAFPAHTVPSPPFTALYAACAHCMCIAVTIPIPR